MKIAFATQETGWDSLIDPRFGRTQFLLCYDEEKDELISVDNRAIEQEAHGAGPKTAQKLFELNPDILITGNGPGGNAAVVLDKTNIDIYTGAGEMTVKEAYEAYKSNRLTRF
jgi:predicted Fe-Mo cluster-binding NifX family protein